MPKPTKKQASIYRLLDIQPGSSKIYILLLTPLLGVWLYAIGKRLLQKQNKSNNAFTFIASLTVVLMTYTMLMLPILYFSGSGIMQINKFMSPISAITCISLILTICILSYITVKYDRLAKPDYHYSLVNSLDYVVRFMTLFYWPFTIWSFQEKVNEYNE